MSRGRQIAFDFESRPALTGDDFLIAPANRDAVAWLDRWPHWPSPALVIHGPPGSGKSHLVQVFMARTGALPVTPALLAEADMERALAAVSVCVADDADQGHDEEALLHLYNSLAEHGGRLLLTASAPPARWGIGLADLASRLGAAQVVAIGPPDDALIEAVLVKLFSDRQLRARAGVVDYLIPRMERSLDAARRLVAAVDAEALATRRDITLALARQVLERME